MVERAVAGKLIPRVLLALACAASTHIASATSAPLAVDPAREAQVMHIAEKLRCLVCQNQSIAESNADLANDLKREVREQLAAGKSERDILDFMVERYGDFVLYEPPVRNSTLLLWGGPLTLLVAAGAGFAWTLKRRRAAQAASTPETTAGNDAAARARARALLEEAPENTPEERA
ncbi:MAG: cytochrome c-type biogenesis protein CcmH [Moraxellaceae bacterium]|nr:cytochrome c-type biogenesis protein CcmH [Moraxellaceae bacterium]